MKHEKFDLSASLFIAVEIRDFQWRLEKGLLKLKNIDKIGLL